MTIYPLHFNLKLKHWDAIKIALLVFILTADCLAQDKEGTAFHLTISPIINRNNSFNASIISHLENFLRTKNNSLQENNYWLPADFEQYVYPYKDIFEIEKSKFGANFYKPTLMEILDTSDENCKILKIAFMGHQSETNDNYLKAIYNIVATKENNNIYFSTYLNLIDQKWSEQKVGKLTYKISPNKEINWDEIEKQRQDISKICTFFNTEEIALKYFSCVSPKEVFEIKGFDYNSLMYVDKTGGLAEYGNILFSGNNSEVYSHEIIHIYTSKLFPNKNALLDEGLAMYLAGSGKYDYDWHKKKMISYLQNNPEVDLRDYFDPYARMYIENETSIPYMIGALLCEKTIQKYGKEKLFELLNSDAGIWELLQTVGINKQNLNFELKKL